MNVQQEGVGKCTYLATDHAICIYIYIYMYTYTHIYIYIYIYCFLQFYSCCRQDKKADGLTLSVGRRTLYDAFETLVSKAYATLHAKHVSCHPRAPSIQIVPTLGSKVCK